MSDHVFVVSEWLPKKGHESELWQKVKVLMAQTQKNEEGCIWARATKQLLHPNAKGETQYTIILLQEYVNVSAFETHCSSPHVLEFIKENIEENAIVEEGRIRLLSDK